MAANHSVLKSFQILEVISQYPEGINLSGIVRETKLPKSTVFDICNALYQTDAIYFKDPIAKTYVIGSKMYIMGQVYTQNSNFIIACEPVLKEFAEKYGVSVSAAKRLHNTSVNVFKYESKKSKVITPDLGTQVRLNEDVCGKVFLAYLDKNSLPKKLEQLNLQNNSKILLELQQIRENGFGFDDNVSSKYIHSIAVPIFNFENKCIGVITSTSLKTTKNDVDEQIGNLMLIANKVSKILGYRK